MYIPRKQQNNEIYKNFNWAELILFTSVVNECFLINENEKHLFKMNLKKIKENCKMGKTVFRETYMKLEKKGLITVSKNKDGNGSLKYTIEPIIWW